MKKLFVFVFLAILISCKGQKDSQSIILTFDEFKTEVYGKDVQLVDVRTSEEYNNGYIDDAINIDFFEKDNFIEKFEQFNKNEPLYIYCASGGRSQRSVKILQEMGFKNIIDLDGGYTVWADNN